MTPSDRTELPVQPRALRDFLDATGQSFAGQSTATIPALVQHITAHGEMMAARVQILRLSQSIKAGAK